MKKRVSATVSEAVAQRLSTSGTIAGINPNSRFEILANIVENRATLSLDTSGTHLHFRGYKPYSVAAPIRSTVAAASLLELDIAQYDNVLDPFCGSGTILLEAWRLRAGRGVEAYRGFAFESFVNFRSKRYNFEVRANQGIASPETGLIGIDVSEHAIKAARENRAILGAQIHLVHTDAFSFDYGTVTNLPGKSLILTNPPYGRRIGSQNTWLRYIKFATANLPLWDIGVIVPEDNYDVAASDLERLFEKRLRFENGGIPAVLIFSSGKGAKKGVADK